MQITLLHNSPLHLAAHGARTCWDSHDKSDTTSTQNAWVEDGGWVLAEDMSIEDFHSKWGDSDCMPECGPADAALIDRVGNKFRHASILEHLTYCFFIEGISRACLQELSRHRMSSPSVKSSRYTLKELKDELPFTSYTDIDSQEYLDDGYTRACKYLVMTPNDKVNRMSILALDNLRDLIVDGISNDFTKYALPEAYKVTEQLTINARSLQNFLSLRTDKSALWEIRDLANALYEALPSDHKYLFVDSVKVYE